MKWHGIAVRCSVSEVKALYQMFRCWQHLRMSEARVDGSNGLVIEFVSFQPFNLIPGEDNDMFRACVVGQMEPLPMCDAHDLFEALKVRQ